MTAPDPPVLHYVSHDRFVADVQAVAVHIEAGDWRPDHIVGIGRGGLVPGVYLSHRIDVPMISLDLSAGLAPFAADRLADLAALAEAGRRLLFVDDINDSGATILSLRQALAALGAAGGCRFAVLIDNTVSRATVDYRARDIDRRTDKDWFVFPWEGLASRATLIGEAREVPERLG